MDQKPKITDWVHPNDKTGEFVRKDSQFRNWIKKGGEFPPEKDRYHLYASYACPWAHRCLIVRQLKGLQDIIRVTVVHWHMSEKGWRFRNADDTDITGEHVEPDPIPGHENFTHLQDVYHKVEPGYTGRYLVPTLYDKKQGKIVSNESADIIRMFYSEFDEYLEPEYQKVDLLPSKLVDSITQANDWIYDGINNGVYKSGFATSQNAYERNVLNLFESLDKVEKQLSVVRDQGPYFFGPKLTETDIRLFTTLVRFDVVYVQHFKCNLRDIRSGYPNIHRWLRNLYWNNPAFHQTTDFTHIKNHYTKSHKQINPFGITPVGPIPNIQKLDEEVAAVSFTT